MSNIESSLSRAQQKIQNRARLKARPGTPEDHLMHMDKLLVEQQELQEMLGSPLPNPEDQGEESGYDPDPEDLEQDTDVYTDMEGVMLEIPPELSAQPQPLQLENRPRHVTFADHIFLETSSPPPPPLLTPSPQPSLEEPLPPPFLPPRTCTHFNNNNTFPRSPNSVPPGLRLGKCTPPKTCGQGYDPPFLYPEFIAKNQKSRVNYILTLVDSLVLQMERFGSLSLKSEEEATDGGSKKPSTGAIPKVRPANSEFSGYPRANRERSGSRSRSQSKGKHSKKTSEEQEVDYDMDYEFCMEQIEDFRANRIRGGSHYYFDDKDPEQERLWRNLRKKQERARQAEKNQEEGTKPNENKAEETSEEEKPEETSEEEKPEEASEVEIPEETSEDEIPEGAAASFQKPERAVVKPRITNQKTFNEWLLYKNQGYKGCDACAAGRTLDVIRGHLARTDYSGPSVLPTPKRRNIGRDSSSSSSSTATLTPNTRPCSPEGQRQPTNRPATDLEQLLDPTTDWPANKKKESRQQRSLLENLFNMTSASPSARITIVAGKRPHQKGAGSGAGSGAGEGAGSEAGGAAGAVARVGAFATYSAPRCKNREGSLIPCMKKRNT